MVMHWLAELDGRRVTVEAPATSANLGAGYDCLGVALGLVNRIDVEVRGWGRGDVELNGEPLTERDLLRVAAGIEGHPDNVATALLGGFVVVGPGDDGLETMRFDAPRDLRALLFVPDLRLDTDRMRAVLPKEVPHADAVANVGRVALGVAGLATGRFELLRTLTVDRLHEPYRAEAFPQLPRLVAAARSAGALGACLSGAGSAILAFGDSVSGLSRIEAALLAAAADTDVGGRVIVVSPRNQGAQVVGRA